MSTNIKVAYDVSLLGAGYLSNQSRTGIFRVLEEILLELHHRDDISVCSVALNKEATIWDDISSLLYFKNEQQNLTSAFHSTHYSLLHLESIYTKLIQLQKVLIDSTKSRSSLLYKAGRALQIVGNQIAKKESLIQSCTYSYDVYHGSYSPLPDAHILPGIPRILTVYDLIPILFSEFVTPRVHQKTIAQLESINIKKDWIVCISEHTKQDFCQHTSMNPSRVFVTPLAAANYFYPVRDASYLCQVLNKYKIPQEPYLLSLCTLEPRKNLDLLIKAFFDFVQAHPDSELNLVLVGISGWKDSKIFQAAQSGDKIKNRIFFTGYLPDEDLAPMYSGALSFVYPSLYEGFGLPPLEAMQCGTPVITSNSSSLPEVVGDSGILVNPKNQSELSHAIWQLVNDCELRSQLSQKSLARARQFSWSKCVDKTVDVYKTAITHKD